VSGRRRQDRLAALAQTLSERDRDILQDVVRLRFVTAGHLARLHFTAISQPLTRIRRVQRTLARLVAHGLLLRLQRRVGGVRAGSASFTYAPSAEAIRLVGFLAGDGIPSARATHEPGTSFVDHTVAASEAYVQLVEAERTGRLELLQHQAEPDCWRYFLGPLGDAVRLRPDAFVALGIGPLEQRSFVEIDRGSEGSAALRRKLRTYADYWRSGAEQHQHGTFPRVIWQVEHPRRGAVLRRLVTELGEETQPLFVVTNPAGLLAALCGDQRPPNRGLS